MANNIKVTEGEDKEVAAEDIGGILLQRIKLVLGAAGVDGGDVASGNPLPITGSISISSLPTLPAGDNNIGNVDIVTMPAITGTVTANMGTLNGAALDATLQSILTELGQKTEPGNTQTISGSVSVAGSVAVTQSTSPWVVGDGGGSLTVDANDLDIRNLSQAQDSVRIGDGTDLATIRILGSAGALDVAIVDGSGNQITSFGGGGGGTQYAEDAALGANPTGTLSMARRKDTLATLTPVDDDAVSLRTNNRGSLWVKHDGTITVDANDLDIRDLAFATDSVDVSGSTVAASQDGAWSVTANAGANLNTSDLALESTLSGLNAKVVAVDTGDVTISAPLPAGTNNIGDVDVLSLPAVTQGTSPWVVGDGGGSLTVDSNNLDIRDLVFATDKVDVTGSTLGANSGVDIGDVTINNASGAAAVNVQDGGNSLTVDGTVAVSGTVAVTQSGTWNLTNISGTISLPTGAATAALQTQPGVDIGDVTVNNAGGAAAINVQDGGNSLTVDGTVSISGTVAVTQSGSWIVQDNASQVDDAAFTPATGRVLMIGAEADETSPDAVDEGDGGALRMTLLRGLHVNLRNASGAEIGIAAAAMRIDPTGTTAQPVTDNGGSLTVDGTVAVSGTVAVTQSGTWNLTNISGTISLPTGAATAALQTQPGVDIGDVTINNSTGASAVNIQDGGNSITVDGSVSISGTATVQDNASQVDDAAFVPGTGRVLMIGAEADETGPDAVDEGDGGALRMTLQRGLHINLRNSSGAEIGISAAALRIDPTGTTAQPVTDNSGSLTIDAPVGTPAFVRLSDGSAAITTLPVSLASVPSHQVTNAGTFAVQVDGNALTSLQLIDDAIFADDAAFTPASSKVMAVGHLYDDVSPDIVDEGDIGISRMNKVRAAGFGRLQSITADLSNVNATYNNTTTTASSQDVDCDGMAWASLSFELTSASTPTDLQFIMEVKDEEDTDYRPIQNEFWARLKIGAAEVASQQKYSYARCPIPEGAINIRLRCVATGTDASKTFTLANAKIGLATAA